MEFMSISLALGLGLLTVLLTIIIRLVFVLYLRPHIKLNKLKGKGGVVHYSASGLASTFHKDQRNHNDYFFLFRNLAKSQPKHRFFASNIGESVWIFLRDPKLIDSYIQSQAKYKKLNSSELFSAIFPSSTLIAEGAIWQAHRTVYDNVLNHKFVDRAIPMIFDTTLEYITYIDPMKSTLDSGSFCKTVIGEVFARLFFGKKFQNFKLENGMTLADMFSVMATGISECGTGFWATLSGVKFVLKGYIPVHQRLLSSVRIFKKFILSVVKDRKKLREAKKLSDPQEFTLIDAIFDHQKNNLETIIDAEVFDEFISFFIAGLETTAQVATLCIVEMAKNTEYRNEVLKEASDLFKNQAKFNLTKLESLPFLEGFVKESMRLNPPIVSCLARQAKETHFLEDLEIPKGAQVQIGILQNHVNQENFKDADVFDPKRWVSGSERASLEERGGYEFCPFSAGPRKCIGEILSKTICKIILACFVKRFEFRLDPKSKMVMTATPIYQLDGQTLLSIRRGSFAA